MAKKYGNFNGKDCGCTNSELGKVEALNDAMNSKHLIILNLFLSTVSGLYLKLGITISIKD